MKLGLFIMPLHPPERPHADCYELDLDLIQLADELGYEEAWIGEHFTNPWENVASPELIIAAALQRTRRIRLGTGVSCLPNHHPAVLAHRIAQLDHMARGRFMFGIGSGATAADTRMVGQVPADARDATRSSIELILRIWERAANGGGPGVSLSNGHWTTELPEQSELVRVHLAPYQRPHPPIAVAGLTRASGTLRIAGEQGWIPMSINIVPPGILRSHWEATVAGAESVGRAADRSLWRISRDIHVADTTEQARREALQGALGRGYREFMLPYVNKTGSVGLLTADEKAAPAVIDDAWLLDNTWIVGDPDEVVRKLEGLHDAVGGFGTLLQIAYDWEDEQERNRRSMELLATEVMPRLEHLH